METIIAIACVIRPDLLSPVGRPRYLYPGEVAKLRPAALLMKPISPEVLRRLCQADRGEGD